MPLLARCVYKDIKDIKDTDSFKRVSFVFIKVISSQGVSFPLKSEDPASLIQTVYIMEVGFVTSRIGFCRVRMRLVVAGADSSQFLANQ